MQREFEKIIERLEERKQLHERMIAYEHKQGTITEEFRAFALAEEVKKLIEIVNQVASEYGDGADSNELMVVESLPSLYPLQDFEEEAICRVVASAKYGGWIPCSERLPEEHDSIFAIFKGTGKWNNSMFEKVSDEVSVTIVGKNGTRATTHAHTIDGKWSCDLLKCDKSYRIIAWRPLPPPYQPKEEHMVQQLPISTPEECGINRTLK